MNCQNSASFVMAIPVSGSPFDTSADSKILGAAERQIKHYCSIYAILMKLELN
jgi:hypothetical protein